jgi:hypothetical protein
LVYLVEDRDLLRPEVRSDFDRLMAQGHIIGVGQGVGRVRAHDESAVTHLGKAQSCGGRDTGLAYATLACVEEDSHAGDDGRWTMDDGR